MKVRITGSSINGEKVSWWYSDKIGEEFEVEQCPKFDKYWITKDETKSINGEGRKKHIYKSDCVLIDDTSILLRSRSRKRGRNWQGSMN